MEKDSHKFTEYERKMALANNEYKGLSDLQTYKNQTHFYITLSFLVWKLW